MNFKEISPSQLSDNPFERIGTEWMLITAGTVDKCNTMTASWGQLGILWSKPVAMIYIRPQRYTKEFVEREERFSLSFFGGGNQREALQLLGAKSGRDSNKIAEAGLHVAGFEGVPAFEEAETVLVCRKLYQQDLVEAYFTDKSVVATNYPDKDFHRLYVGEIEHVFVR